MKIALIPLFWSVLICLSCNQNKAPIGQKYTISIKEMNVSEYPDNPTWGHEAAVFSSDIFEKSELIQHTGQSFSWHFSLNNDKQITIPQLDLSEFIPTVPNTLKTDAYLSYLAVINQEWNRNQVKFDTTLFQTSDARIKRIDIARNCLNAYLWEVILFTQENGEEKEMGHGWFEFPKPLYQQLFEEKNNISFKKYQIPLENWVNPPSEPIQKTQLRRILDMINSTFTDLSDTMYPLKGERLRKKKNIITPQQFSTMRQLQDTKSTFATFSPPGFYTKSDPRYTELGRFFRLDSVQIYHTKNASLVDTTYEINLFFKSKNEDKKTIFTVGGLNLKQIPKKSHENAHEGWQNSMGFGNHTFYETYQKHINYKTKDAPYYAFLSDEKGKWLDSHTLGIDGPLLHCDENDASIIHVWLLSFERHAFIGHYALKILKNEN